MTRKRHPIFIPSALIALFVPVLLVALATSGVLASTPPLFLPAVTYRTGDHNPVSLAVADINGDGKPDIVVVNQFTGPDFSIGGSTVGVLLGNGDGTFQPPVTYDSGGSFAYSVAVGDFNGDGKPDLAVANGCVNIGGFNCSPEGLVGILMGNGDGTFQAVHTYDSGGFDFFNSNVVVADVNGDGKQDLVVMNGCSRPCDNINPPQGSVGILLGNGDGTFNSAATYASGGYFSTFLAVADLNSDEKLDVVVANWCAENSFVGNCGTKAPIGVLLGNGDGSLQPVITYRSGGEGARSVAVADVNADGKPDLVVSDCGPDGCAPGGVGDTSVLLGNGNGTFQPAVSYNSGGSTISVAVADVDGDGKSDLVAANWGTGTVGILLGNGDGTFRGVQTFDSGGTYPIFVAAADVNADGRPDLAVAQNGGNNGTGLPPGAVAVLLNNTALVDKTPPVITVSATPKALWPPNRKMVPVTISGTITDTGSGVNVNSVAYAVKDEYGEVQPDGAITLGPGGAYSFTILLQASRLGTDLDGRRYMITVRAKDNAGNGASKMSVVTVPHDHGH
jgi:hypothetical protein